MRYVTQYTAFEIVDADADEMSEHYARTLSPAKVEPLGPGTGISVVDRHYSAGPFSIWFGHCPSGMKVTFSQPSDVHVLYIPAASAMEIDTGRQSFAAGPGTVFVGDMSRFEKLTLHEKRSHIGIAFDKSAMVGQLSQLLDAPVLNDIELTAIVDITSVTGSRLAALGHLLWDRFASGNYNGISTAVADHLMRAGMVMLLETIPHNYSTHLAQPISPAMPRSVKRAIDYMMANISQSMSVADIAREAGTSVRSLQAAFQQFKDTTPLGFLRQARLEGVCRTLADETNALPIAQVARAWGFTHMGRFSAVYQGAFGETPSETARRRRRRS